MGILNYTIVTLGSHSALQILKGAKDEGFKTAVVCTPDRLPLYKTYDNFIDKYLMLDKWSDFPKLEKELLRKINSLGIGPMGLGGRTTCLGVNILEEPTHIAGLPVAVNMSCHATRSAAGMI